MFKLKSLVIVIVIITCYFNYCFAQAKPDKTYYCNLNRPTKIPVNELIKSIDIIPLGTKEGCLINRITDVRLLGNRVYALDDNNGNILYVFDKKGRYLNKIDKRGGGPGEYRSLTCFDVSEADGSISLYDGVQSKVLVFNPDFTLKKSLNLGNKELYGNCFRLSNSTPGGYVFSANVLTELNRNLIFIKDSLLRTKDKMIITDLIKIPIPGELNTFSSGKECLYYYNNNDGWTYVLTNDTLESRISVKFSARSYLPGQLNEQDLDISNTVYNKGDVVTNFITKTTDSFMHTVFFYDRQLQVLIINRKTGEMYLYSKLEKKSCQCGVMFFPCSTTTDGRFIFAVDAVDVKDFINLIDPSSIHLGKDGQNAIQSIGENDNPLLFLVAYK
jgi:hypothetical protein